MSKDHSAQLSAAIPIDSGVDPLTSNPESADAVQTTRPAELLLPIPNDVDSIALQSPSPMPTENASKILVQPTAIPGCLNAHNDGAFDWGWQGCLAYGMQTLVVVLDARTMSKVQVLDLHKHHVAVVRWARENYCHGPRQSYSLRLASADIQGCIIVWDVLKGAAQSKFGESEGPVFDMAWHWHQDATQDLLLCLHANSCLVLWNATTGTMIWKKIFARVDHHLEAFDLDPHQPNRAVFIASDGIWMIQDMSFYKSPSHDLERISWYLNGRLTGVHREGLAGKDVAVSPTSIRSDIKQRASKLLSRNSLVVSNIPEVDSNSLLEIYFHRNMYNVLIAVYPRQILFISIRYGSVFRQINSEKAAVPFQSVIPVRQLDAFYCLHTNGSISFRSVSKPSTNALIVPCDAVNQPEATRLLKHCKIFGFAVDPVSEMHLSVLLNDGRILAWKLDSGDNELRILPSSFISPPRIFLTCMTTPLHSPPLVIQANLLVSERDHLIAVGSSKGTVQIFQHGSSILLREYFIQNNPIQGLEWITPSLLLIYSYPHTGSPAALVRSEIVLLDLRIGSVRLLRKSVAEESPIRTVKVSPAKDHLVIVFKNGVPEIWNILEGRQLVWHRPRSVPHATAAEWVVVLTPAVDDPATSDAKVRKELILFVDLKGLFQAFRVKGNIIHEDKSSVFTTQATIGHVTAMCRKRNKIVMGDVDGSLIKWTPSESLAETKNLNRGWIKNIKFAPKDRTMWAAVLFSDGLDVWEIETMELINQVRPKLYKINSFDWVSATHLALCCMDGCIRIYDCRNFITCSSIVNVELLHEDIKNPYLLSQEAIRQEKATRLMLVKDHESDEDAATSLRKQELADLRRSFSMKTQSSADRCFLTSLFMGDESDYHFWKACLRSLPSVQSALKDKLGLQENFFLLDKDSLQEHVFSMTSIVLDDSTGVSNECTRKCIQDLISVGASSVAVEHILGLDPNDPNYYTDSLKAALLTSLNGHSSETVQSTIKLVATSLIANTTMASSGIELLCMIGKMLEACRYLQSCGKYTDAANLAKLCLSTVESKEIMTKWVDYLCAPEINQKSLALLICLHAGFFDRALELMATSRQFERAAMFLQACEEDGILEPILQGNLAMCEAVYLEYARYLHSIGLKDQAMYFCDKGGKNGRLLRQEFEILNRDHNVHSG
ncbi:WD repeat-containing protein 11-like [Paramacrobiotus metropolitanus]|uniref:WD repeat-containing protein 11-like n=1 Tax=Paramacrobiotus metropolitanus TaxID=2943436 RepID=UPI002445BB71|nr:WD repeat-containing protein 11-like [Paramacrobiotus metropolitanus]